MGANVWLLKGYFDTVPREIDEAAIVDGASHARIFFTMHLRLITPILVTVVMIAFVGLFNEFLLASIFLKDVDSQTLAVGLYGMNQADKSQSLRPVLPPGRCSPRSPSVAALPGRPEAARSAE